MSDRKRELYFVNMKTGEKTSPMDVSGQSERQIERCLLGMTINIGADWRVHDTAWDDALEAVKEGE